MLNGILDKGKTHYELVCRRYLAEQEDKMTVMARRTEQIRERVFQKGYQVVAVLEDDGVGVTGGWTFQRMDSEQYYEGENGRLL